MEKNTGAQRRRIAEFQARKRKRNNRHIIINSRFLSLATFFYYDISSGMRQILKVILPDCSGSAGHFISPSPYSRTRNYRKSWLQIMINRFSSNVGFHNSDSPYRIVELIWVKSIPQQCASFGSVLPFSSRRIKIRCLARGLSNLTLRWEERFSLLPGFAKMYVVL